MLFDDLTKADHFVYNAAIMISAIILSAGLSQRFGSPKALALVNNITIIEHLQKVLVDTEIENIYVVLGANADEIKAYILNHKKVHIVYNKNFKSGQTSSFKAGLKALPIQSNAVMLFPVDAPFVKKETISAVISRFRENYPSILVPTHQNKKGHPPVFNISLLSQLLNLSDDTGLNQFQHENKDKIVLFEVDDPGVVQSFNTKEELDAIVLSAK